jgi:hypothetical protein
MAHNQQPAELFPKARSSSSMGASGGVSHKRAVGEKFYWNAKDARRFKLLTVSKPIRDKQGVIIQVVDYQEGEGETKPVRVAPGQCAVLACLLGVWGLLILSLQEAPGSSHRLPSITSARASIRSPSSEQAAHGSPGRRSGPKHAQGRVLSSSNVDMRCLSLAPAVGHRRN